MRKNSGAHSNKSITIHGVELAYDDEGHGPPVVCLHAIGHGAGDYRELSKRLTAQYRVIALDWPGHGASGDERESVSDRRYAEHLAAFVDALGLQTFILLGNSVGGSSAIRYAAQHPDRVSALILVNSGGLFMRPPGFSLMPKLMARMFDAGAHGARWFPWAFSAFYQRMLIGEAALEQRDRIIAAAVEMSPLLAQAWRWFSEPGSDVRHLVEQIRCPVLVAWAILDPVNPLFLNRPAIRRFHDVRIETFRAGHSPFLELPDEFVATFSAFVQGRLARSAEAPSIFGNLGARLRPA